jgi:hypothetical protein
MCGSGPVLLALFLAVSSLPALGAFEFDSRTAAERGCSHPDALGLVPGSASPIYHPSHAAACEGVAGTSGYRPFGLAGIGVLDARVRLALGGKRIGLNVAYSGLAAPGYGERVLSASVGFSRGRLWLQPGLRLGQTVAPGGYGGHALIFDFLTYAYVNPAIRVSFEAGNAFASALNAQGGGIPSRLGAGIGYAISRSVACGFRVEKENGLRTALRTGIEWKPASGFFVRLGSCTFPRELSVGLGLRIGGLGLDFSTTANLDLGTTHAAGATYAWN